MWEVLQGREVIARIVSAFRGQQEAEGGGRRENSSQNHREKDRKEHVIRIELSLEVLGEVSLRFGEVK